MESAFETKNISHRLKGFKGFLNLTNLRKSVKSVAKKIA
jgi:hypothetical protein